MRLRPDFDHTVTGYRWLDRLTAPFWAWYDRRAQRRLFELLGDGDTEAGRQMLADAFELERRGRGE